MLRSSPSRSSLGGAHSISSTRFNVLERRGAWLILTDTDLLIFPPFGGGGGGGYLLFSSSFLPLRVLLKR